MQFPEQPTEQPGCPLCGRPLIQEHILCSACEMDMLKQKNAVIYRFPTGERLTDEEISDLARVGGIEFSPVS